MKKIYFPFLFLIVTLFCSCVKDLDFDQADDLELTPSLVVSLLKFDITQKSLTLPSGSELPSIKQRSVFDALEGGFVKDNLVRLKFDFEFSNEFDFNFEMDFALYDNSGDTITYQSDTITILPNVRGYKKEQEIIVSAHPDFFKSKFIEFTFRLLPSDNGLTIDTGILKKLNVQSSATLYFKID